MFEFILMILFGFLLIVVGIFNIRGNLSSIHWYHRKNITKENQHLYGKLMGTGTAFTGFSLVITGILQLFMEKESWFYITLIGVVIGISFMLYAQLKYNKSIF